MFGGEKNVDKLFNFVKFVIKTKIIFREVSVALRKWRKTCSPVLISWSCWTMWTSEMQLFTCPLALEKRLWPFWLWRDTPKSFRSKSIFLCFLNFYLHFCFVIVSSLFCLYISEISLKSGSGQWVLEGALAWG